MDKEKIEELTALVSVETALNDIIRLLFVGKPMPQVDVVKDPEGFPRVHISLVDTSTGGTNG